MCSPSERMMGKKYQEEGAGPLAVEEPDTVVVVDRTAAAAAAAAVGEAVGIPVAGMQAVAVVVVVEVVEIHTGVVVAVAAVGSQLEVGKD